MVMMRYQVAAVLILIVVPVLLDEMRWKGRSRTKERDGILDEWAGGDV